MKNDMTKQFITHYPRIIANFDYNSIIFVRVNWGYYGFHFVLLPRSVSYGPPIHRSHSMIECATALPQGPSRHVQQPFALQLSLADIRRSTVLSGSTVAVVLW